MGGSTRLLRDAGGGGGGPLGVFVATLDLPELDREVTDQIRVEEEPAVATDGVVAWRQEAGSPGAPHGDAVALDPATGPAGELLVRWCRAHPPRPPG